MPTVDLPGMRSMSTDSACIARHRSSARPVILLYFTPASGLNSNVVTTGPGMNLRDLALDGELAALLLELPRRVHQLALVDLALGLRRVEQRRRRQRERALPALRRRLQRLGLGQRQRRRLRPSCCATTGGAGRERPALDARLDRPAAAHAPVASSPVAGGLRPRSIGGRCLLRVLGDHLAARAFACGARRASRAASRRRAPRGPASSRVAVANIRPNENCVDRITDSIISVSRTMIEPVRLR